MAGMTILLSNTNHNDSWILNTGITNHMTYNKDWLSNLHKFDNTKVKLPTGKFVFVVANIGNDNLTNEKFLNIVLHVPDFKFNLLSVSKLTKYLSCSVIFFLKFLALWEVIEDW